VLSFSGPLDPHANRRGSPTVISSPAVRFYFLWRMQAPVTDGPPLLRRSIKVVRSNFLPLDARFSLLRAAARAVLSCSLSVLVEPGHELMCFRDILFQDSCFFFPSSLWLHPEPVFHLSDAECCKFLRASGSSYPRFLYVHSSLIFFPLV